MLWTWKHRSYERGRKLRNLSTRSAENCEKAQLLSQEMILGAECLAEISKDISHQTFRWRGLARTFLNNFDGVPRPSVFLSLFNISSQDIWLLEQCNIIRNFWWKIFSILYILTSVKSSSLQPPIVKIKIFLIALLHLDNFCEVLQVKSLTHRSEEQSYFN